MKEEIDNIRLKLSKSTSDALKAEFGQYFTPGVTAAFMASLFSHEKRNEYRILDPGAGIGSLSIALLDVIPFGVPVSITACELDATVRKQLVKNFCEFASGADVQVVSDDFIKTAVNWLQFEPKRRFTHVIMNPPYKKISNQSAQRHLLRSVYIETVNLYSAFVALALDLLVSGGELVAIIPRSFCNGPYYKPFRDRLLSDAAISHIHLFDSRKSTFKDDHVLQENIILKLVRGGRQGDVAISSSSDDSYADYTERKLPFTDIVFPDDAEHFIRIPTSEMEFSSQSQAICHSLDEIGLTVSTGPIVDFRFKKFLHPMPGPGTVPLLYPIHLGHGHSEWPKADIRKPNAIDLNDQTRRWLFPVGFYCAVKRFSSKEEAKRIMASVIVPDSFGAASALGFENHLNIFHANKEGIPMPLAYGLSVFLNASMIDSYFRTFNGHTQVNATDLRQIRYPSREILIELGKWAVRQSELTQGMIDAQFERLLK